MKPPPERPSASPSAVLPRARSTGVRWRDGAIDQNVLQIRAVGHPGVQIRPHCLLAPADKAFKRRVPDSSLVIEMSTEPG